MCTNCNSNNACYHNTTIINGISNSEHLCLSCYNKLYKNEFFSNFKNSFVSNIFSFFDYLVPRYRYCNSGNLYNDAIKSINIGADNYRNNLSNINLLEKQMQDAIMKEDYETAGKIKKQLDELRG
jgi:protein-arginine kinase activator protein McsA